jgi:hypothetical protein
MSLSSPVSFFFKVLLELLVSLTNVLFFNFLDDLVVFFFLAFLVMPNLLRLELEEELSSNPSPAMVLVVGLFVLMLVLD